MYVSVADLQARMPQFTLKTDSKPSIADAELLLGDVEAEVDAILTNLGYVVPVTGALSTRIVQSIVCDGAIARILRARSAGVGGDAAGKSAELAQKCYDDRLKALAAPREENPLELTDCVRTDLRTDKPIYQIGARLYDDDGDKIEPRTTRDMVH